jgi:hypothetical protein
MVHSVLVQRTAYSRTAGRIVPVSTYSCARSPPDRKKCRPTSPLYSNCRVCATAQAPSYRPRVGLCRAPVLDVPGWLGVLVARVQCVPWGQRCCGRRRRADGSSAAYCPPFWGCMPQLATGTTPVAARAWLPASVGRSKKASAECSGMFAVVGANCRRCRRPRRPRQQSLPAGAQWGMADTVQYRSWQA